MTSEDASAIFVAKAKRRGQSFALSASFATGLLRLSVAEQLRQIDWLVDQLSNKRAEILKASEARNQAYDPNAGKAKTDMNTKPSQGNTETVTD